MAKLFGSSGVRSLVNIDLTPALAARIGMAAATHSKAKTALVARDTRTSGLMLENAVVSGLLSCGVKVTCLGIIPTPALAFLTREADADVGVMITASHNPPQYNGIKIFDRKGMAYNEESQDEIERILEQSRFNLADWRNIGEAHSTDMTRLYTRMIERSVKLRRKWHVVVDPGCGATYNLGPSVLTTIGCTITAFNSQPDGFFPARNPEPDEESLRPLARAVKSLNADVGIAYDGDGDRAAFIDEKGAFADFDRVLAAYAAYVTNRKGGGIVVTNVEASMCVEKMVEPHGGKVVRTKVGDVFLSEAIRKNNAVFGGEPCGAWIHPHFHYCPDGILSSALVLKTLEDEDKTLSEFIAETPRYTVLRRNIKSSNDKKHRIIEKAGSNFAQAFPDYSGLSKVDGIRISLKDGWILLRASGTEPTIRVTVEGESLKAAKKIMEKGTRLIEQLAKEVKQ